MIDSIEHSGSGINASVIVCTYNRSDSLKRTLASLASMNVPGNITWEILVVDNNSRDLTKEVVEKFSNEHDLDVVYRFEGIQGKSFALNEGIEAARGNILAFTDDDVLVHPDWLANILKIFQETKASCVGGKILLKWESPRPAWLSKLLVDQLGYLDLGEKMIRLNIAKIYGANLAVPSKVIRKYRGFDTKAGPVAAKMYSGEDTYLIEKLIDGEEIVLYCPSIVVYHRIPKEHLRKIYFLKRMFDQGESIGFRMGEYPHRNFLGIPFYLYKELFTHVIRSLVLLGSDPEKAFNKQVETARCLGIMRGRLKFAKSHIRQK